MIGFDPSLMDKEVLKFLEIKISNLLFLETVADFLISLPQ